MSYIIEYLKVVFLGIVEGITEWLPISSTGHMLLVDEIFTLDQTDAFKEFFFVAIQLGAIAAVVVIFWNKMWPFQLKNKEEKFVKMDTIITWLKVAVACIPSVIVGLLFDDAIEEIFYTPFWIAVMLIVYGLAFIFVENWNKKRTPRISELEGIDFKTAFLIGIFQALAVMPGTSRSGATIVGALIIGISRTAAAEFTFFLATPTMIGATGLKFVKYLLDGNSFDINQILILTVGMIIAFVVSMLCIRWLMSFIKKHDFKPFGWYRIALGAVVLILLALGIFA